MKIIAIGAVTAGGKAKLLKLKILWMTLNTRVLELIWRQLPKN